MTDATKIQLSDIRDLVDYEKLREAMRGDVIALKQRRRVELGENLSLLFENRQTVIFQIQEMVRSERIVEPAKIQQEIDAYAALLPDDGELAATLFIEIPGIASLAPEEARAAVNRFQGIDQGCLFLELGGERVPARFESGHSREEKLAAVQYIRFAIPAEARRALADHSQGARLVVEHPRYRSEQSLSREVREQLLEDLLAAPARR